MGDYASIQLYVPRSNVADVHGIAEDLGIDPQRDGPDQRVDLETSAAETTPPILIGAGSLLVGQFVARLIDRLPCGVTIDVRPRTAAIVRCSQAVPYGWALVLTSDDRSVRIETHGAPAGAAEGLLRQLVIGAWASSSTTLEAARQALGDSKVTTS